MSEWGCWRRGTHARVCVRWAGGLEYRGVPLPSHLVDEQQADGAEEEEVVPPVARDGVELLCRCGWQIARVGQSEGRATSDRNNKAEGPELTRRGEDELRRCHCAEPAVVPSDLDAAQAELAEARLPVQQPLLAEGLVGWCVKD